MVRTECNDADVPPHCLVPRSCTPPCPLHTTPCQVAGPSSPHALHCHAPHTGLLCWCDFLFFFFLLTSSFAAQSPHSLTILFANGHAAILSLQGIPQPNHQCYHLSM